MSYYEDAYRKKEKGQPLYFQPRLWPTLNEKPRIGNSFFMDESIYNSAKLIASKEIEDTKSEEFENRVLFLYNEMGGEIENFDAINYQLPASISQIHDMTFKIRQYTINVLVTQIIQDLFPTTIGILIPFSRTRSLTISETTLPEFTENYERVLGQRHTSNYLTIDTTRILRKNGNYYPKIRLGGSSIGQVAGTIAFAGGGIPITSLSLNLENSFFITAIGNINEVETNEFGEDIENRANWSLKREFRLFEEAKIERLKLSQLALNGLGEVGLE